MCGVVSEKDFVDEVCWVGCKGGRFGVIGVEEWYMRDAIGRRHSGGGRGILCVLDFVGLVVIRNETNPQAGLLDEVLLRQW